jgi:hypothetical protein
VFALTLLLMLLASINYQLNLGYALTFLLAGAGLVSMHLTHGTLRGLTCTCGPRPRCSPATPALLEVVLTNPGAERYGVACTSRTAARTVPAGSGRRAGTGQASARLAFVPPRRGRFAVPALVAETVFPFGLFRAWTVWRPAGHVLAWPRPESRRRRCRPPPRPDDHRPQQPHRDGAELDGVRPWRRGDSLRQVVWKKVARSGELVSRDTAGAARANSRSTGRPRAADPELRLSRLAAWVLAADRAGHAYGCSCRAATCPSARATSSAARRWTPWRSGIEILPDDDPDTWHRLPRDARDTLFQLGVIGWTLLPHAAAPAAVVQPAGRRDPAVARAAGLNGRRCPALERGRGAGAGRAADLWSERTLLGREAGVTLLVVLMALKTLELRARRDALVVFFLGFFLVLTNFLYSQSLVVALSMLVSVWGLLTALVLAHMPVGGRRCSAPAAAGARAALLGAAVDGAAVRCCSRAWRRCGACRRTPPGAPGCRARCDGRRGRDRQRRQHRDARALLRPRAQRRPAVLSRAGAGRFDGREWTRLPSFPPPQRLRSELQVFGAPVATS